MPDQLVTVTKDEFATFRDEVYRQLKDLNQKIGYIIDPERGLYLSVHRNGQKVDALEKELTELKATVDKNKAEQSALNEKLKEKDNEIDRFKTRVTTSFVVIQTIFGAAIALIALFLKG